MLVHEAEFAKATVCMFALPRRGEGYDGDAVPVIRTKDSGDRLLAHVCEMREVVLLWT